MNDKKPLAFVVYGCHASGKTYVAKQIEKLHNAIYISTDFAEVYDTSRHNLKEMENIQERYIEHVLGKYKELIKNPPSPDKKIVIDFGAYQVIPYGVYFWDKYLLNNIDRIERYEKRLEEVYNVERLLVVANKNIVRKRVETREENRSKDFELKSLDDIYKLFLEMPIRYKMTMYWNNGDENDTT